MVNAAVEQMEKPPISAEPPRRSRVTHSQTSEEDYDCEGVFPNGGRPLWDESDWAIARNLYLSQVGMSFFPVWGARAGLCQRHIGSGCEKARAASLAGHRIPNTGRRQRTGNTRITRH
jgi:hypothetical protein